MRTILDPMKMVLWEKREMKDRKLNKETGQWEATGEMVERTLYTLRDEYGEVLKFLAGNEYRDLEGTFVQVGIEFEFNEYQNKNTMKLDSIESSSQSF